MAQQTGQIQFIGKVGNLIGFTNSASNKQGAVFVREAPDDVYNPQSNGQATQRSRLKPALNFYAAFSQVLSCAFYPTRKENKNKHFFISRAMKMTTMSDVRMGENLVPLLPYLVSRGYLGLDALCEKVGEHRVSERKNVVLFGVKYDYVTEGDYPISFISDYLLNQNPELENGLQFTILAVLYMRDDDSLRKTVTLSFVLDRENDDTIWADIPGTNELAVDGYPIEDGQDVFYLGISPIDLDWEVGSASLIISGRKGKTWDYTNSVMQLTVKGEEIRARRARVVRPSYQPSHHPVI